MNQHDIRETPHLIVQIARQVVALVQGELKLAKAELSHNLSRAGVGVAFLAVASLLSLVALNVLATALVAYIAEAGLSVGLAALIVGGGLLAVAAVIALIGKSRLSADALVPTRTTRNLKRDIQHIKESIHD